MYQATSHKLEQERDEIQEKALTARELLREGLPPVETADAEFEKMLQVQAQKQVDAQAAAQRKQEEDIMNSNFTRTTAEPRVNAYIQRTTGACPRHTATTLRSSPPSA